LETVHIQPAQGSSSFCSSCGKPLKPGAKFCVYCGAPSVQAAERKGPSVASVQEASVSEAEKILPRPEENESEETVLLNEKIPEKDYESTVILKETPPEENNVVTHTDIGSSSSGSGQIQDQKRKGNGIIVVLIIVAALLLVAAVGLGVIFFVPDVREKISFLKGGAVETDSGNGNDSKSDEVMEAYEDTTETEENVPEEIPEEKLEELEKLIEEGKAELENEHYEDEDGCIALLKNAMQKCMEFTEQYAESEDLEDLAEEAFSVYADVIFAQVDLLFAQDVRPELYEQMESDLNTGLEQAEKLTGAGFTVDTGELDEKLEELKVSYAERYIERFNAFTEAETWSRTESWDLMSDADSIGLVDYGNMDDPMTQRYAYALARVTVKNVENALNDGSMSEEDAVKELESVLQDSDYNLFLMNELAIHLFNAGDDKRAAEVVDCVNKIIEHIYDSQGIDLLYDIPLDHFWSFNEFDEYSVSSDNGLTQSNHEWIRNFMEGKL